MKGFGARLVAAALAMVFAFLAHLALGGSLWYPPTEVARALFGQGSPETLTVVLELRMPRALAALGVGLGLGATGAAFQALFRNPLAEPYVVGVSSGAAVGGTLMILLGWAGAAGTMVGSVAGGILVLVAVLALAQRGDRVVVAGIVAASALSGLLTANLVAAGEDSNQVLRWLLGSTTPMDYARAGTVTVAAVVGGLVLWWNGRQLNALKTGEQSAERLGVDVVRATRTVVGVGGTLASLAVGAAGIVGFVGLAAPHIARGLVGHDERRALPTSACLGAVLLLLADVVAQRALPVGELPLGAVTAVLGAPVVYVLLRRGVGRRLPS